MGGWLAIKALRKAKVYMKGNERWTLLQIPDQQHFHLLKLLPCDIIGDDIVRATGYRRAKLNGVRGSKLVKRPQSYRLISNIHI